MPVPRVSISIAGVTKSFPISSSPLALNDFRLTGMSKHPMRNQDVIPMILKTNTALNTCAMYGVSQSIRLMGCLITKRSTR